MDINEKRNFLRTRIRRDQIEKYLGQKRKQFQIKHQQQEEAKALEKIMDQLPGKVHELMVMVSNDEGGLVEYLFEKVNVLIGSFKEVGQSQWAAYLYIFEKMLLHEPLSSTKRLNLIQLAVCPTLKHCQILLKTAAFFRKELLTNLFCFLTTFGDDARHLGVVQLSMITQYLRNIFVDKYGNSKDILIYVLSFVNNILIQVGQNQGEEYAVEMQKATIMKGLNGLVVSQIIKVGIGNDEELTQIVLRLMVSYTMLLSCRKRYEAMLPTLSVLILSCVEYADNPNIMLVDMRLCVNIILEDDEYGLYLHEQLTLPKLLMTVMKSEKCRQNQFCMEQFCEFVKVYLERLGRVDNTIAMLVETTGLSHFLIQLLLQYHQEQEIILPVILETILLLLHVYPPAKTIINQQYSLFDQLLMYKQAPINEGAQLIINKLTQQ